MSSRQLLLSTGRPTTDAEWAAISNRRGANPFLFVVASTGIICTPGCPARTPGRDRIRVIDRFDDGLSAGARACLRCRPDKLFPSPSTPAIAEPAAGAAGREEVDPVSRAGGLVA